MTDNRILNLTVGWSFILLGIAGSVLPVLQGFLFFVVGLLFLSREYQWAHRLLEWMKRWVVRYFPRASKVFENAEQFLITEIHKMSNERGYFIRRLWVIVAVIVGLGVLGWLISLGIGWLYRLIFK
jgi:uncharacterized membrane protein YbaN (DUF454 family)